MIDHKKAEELMLAERYMLGELDFEKSREFEEHYFECADCTRVMRVLETLQTEVPHLADKPVRAVLGEPEAPRSPWWASLIESFRMPVLAPIAALILAATSLAMFAQNQRLRSELAGWYAAHSPVTATLLPAARSQEKVIRVSEQARSVLLEFDAPADTSEGELVCEVRLGGNPLFQARIGSPKAGAPLQLSLPASRLSPGRYDLLVRAGDTNSAKAVTYQFAIERTNSESR